jgi:hypothetical protein
LASGTAGFGDGYDNDVDLGILRKSERLIRMDRPGAVGGMDVDGYSCILARARKAAKLGTAPGLPNSFQLVGAQNPGTVRISGGIHFAAQTTSARTAAISIVTIKAVRRLKRHGHAFTNRTVAGAPVATTKNQ